MIEPRLNALAAALPSSDYDWYGPTLTASSVPWWRLVGCTTLDPEPITDLDVFLEAMREAGLLHDLPTAVQ